MFCRALGVKPTRVKQRVEKTPGSPPLAPAPFPCGRPRGEGRTLAGVESALMADVIITGGGAGGKRWLQPNGG